MSNMNVPTDTNILPEIKLMIHLAVNGVDMDFINEDVAPALFSIRTVISNVLKKPEAIEIYKSISVLKGEYNILGAKITDRQVVLAVMFGSSAIHFIVNKGDGRCLLIPGFTDFASGLNFNADGSFSIINKDDLDLKEKLNASLHAYDDGAFDRNILTINERQERN